MYTCKESIDLLLNFVDGDLAPEEEKHLHQHLADCPPCVDFLRQYKATPGVCKRALAHAMPREVGERLTQFLRKKCKPSP